MNLRKRDGIKKSLGRRISALGSKLETPGLAECWLPVAILTLIGISLLWMSNISESKKHRLDGVLTNIGTGFIAAAVLTGSLELQAQRKRSRFIDEAVSKIGNATADSLLQGFAPDKRIFRTIKESIFNKEFFRTNYHVSARLVYHEDPGFLVFTKTISYSIKNTSSSDSLQYEISMAEEKEMDSLYPESTKILHVSYALSGEPEWDPDIDRVVAVDLCDENTSTDASGSFELLKFSAPVTIGPDSYLHVKLVSQVVVPSTDKYVFVSTISSTGLTFELTEHPGTLEVIALPILPNASRLKIDACDDHMIRWKIVDGMLPGQGLLIRWMPRPTKRFEQIPSQDIPDVQANQEGVPHDEQIG